MFKRRFLLICSVIALSVLTAGSMATADTTFGVKAGVSMTNLSGLDGSSKLTGLTLGGFASFRLAGNLFLQPELNLVQRGATYEHEANNYLIGPIRLNGKIRVQCLEIPVLAKWNLVSGKPVTPSLLAGPYAAFKLNTRWNGKLQAAGYEFDIEDYYDLEDFAELKSAEFGIVLGGALDYKLGKSVLVFDLRYVLGLSEAAKVIDGTESVKTRTFTATVGIGF
jgi:hypothetical protein